MAILRVALIQLSAGPDLAANTTHALEAIERAAGAGQPPDLIALPETFLYRGPLDGYLASAAEIPGPTTAPFQDAARGIHAWILLGSIAERSGDLRRPYNTSVLIDPAGTVAACYRKRHLFDVTVDDGPADRESARATAGEDAVVAHLPSAAHGADGPEDIELGLSICFDLRFPELYRELAVGGAQILAVPANFTERTGRDHWEVLLRARAIENGAFVIAPAQFGVGAGIPAYGHSMVVDPWGIVVAQAPDGPAIVRAELDLARVASTRRQIPSLPRSPISHRPPGGAPRDPSAG